ncbi:TPA: hypothetical protein DEP34_02135 [Candidatus Uhrbacteria bacterium]|nr:hypothetical protein [Candidatus Uhrbacteria bacterium]HCB19161.1 hypothetical protein [Candidatus Uhrbacteria bacterium]
MGTIRPIIEQNLSTTKCFFPSTQKSLARFLCAVLFFCPNHANKDSFPYYLFGEKGECIFAKYVSRRETQSLFFKNRETMRKFFSFLF